MSETKPLGHPKNSFDFILVIYVVLNRNVKLSFPQANAVLNRSFP